MFDGVFIPAVMPGSKWHVCINVCVWDGLHITVYIHLHLTPLAAWNRLCNDARVHDRVSVHACCNISANTQLLVYYYLNCDCKKNILVVGDDDDYTHTSIGRILTFGRLWLKEESVKMIFCSSRNSLLGRKPMYGYDDDVAVALIYDYQRICLRLYISDQKCNTSLTHPLPHWLIIAW